MQDLIHLLSDCTGMGVEVWVVAHASDFCRKGVWMITTPKPPTAVPPPPRRPRRPQRDGPHRPPPSSAEAVVAAPKMASVSEEKKALELRLLGERVAPRQRAGHWPVPLLAVAL